MAFPEGKPFNIIKENIMNTSHKRMSIIAGALLSTAVLSTPASAADVMLGTGGFNRELHTMGMMKMLDANGDHMVSRTEAMDYYGALFDMLDTNKDGSIDAREWVGTKGKQGLSIATGGYATQLRTMKMMGMMDADGDHKVTKDEFVKFQESTFSAMDKKGDGMITAESWLRKTTGN
jgi:Ca2+-binding EF-hand superfamily protein